MTLLQGLLYVWGYRFLLFFSGDKYSYLEKPRKGLQLFESLDYKDDLQKCKKPQPQEGKNIFCFKSLVQ